VSQVGRYISKLCQPLFYFCGVGKAGADAPPNPSHPVWKCEVICQFCKHNRISVGVEERKRERQPSAAWSDCNQIQQEYQHVVSVTCFCRDRFFMNNFKIDQTRPVGFVIVDRVAHRCITVRPRTAEFVAPELMRPAQFAACRLQHLRRERALA